VSKVFTFKPTRLAPFLTLSPLAKGQVHDLDRMST